MAVLEDTNQALVTALINHIVGIYIIYTKYIIYNDENKKNVYVNDDIPGSAWFVKENINVANDNDEIISLDSLNFKNISVSQDLESKKYKNTYYRVDLIEKKSNYLKYEDRFGRTRRRARATVHQYVCPYGGRMLSS